MASPSLLDFAALTAPLPGDDPTGEAVPFDVKTKLDEFRREDDLSTYAPNDPTRPAEPKVANWSGVIALTQEVLTETSKDLLMAARLTEALTRVHGFVGLRDGLQLLQLLITDCWDRIRPLIEDPGDEEMRAGPFNWLDDPDRGARFPSSVRLLPLIEGADHHYSWVDWKNTTEGKAEIKAEDFQRAADAMPREAVTNLLDDINTAVAQLASLTAALEEKLRNAAPAMMMLRAAMTDCQTLVQQLLLRKGDAPRSADDAGDSAVPTGPALEEGVGAVAATLADSGKRLLTRADVYQRLTEAANLLQKMEPHSPIPYLIQRAVQLGAMPFPVLMKSLIRDAGVLEEMNRELGIPEEKQ